MILLMAVTLIAALALTEKILRSCGFPPYLKIGTVYFLNSYVIPAVRKVRQPRES